MSQPDRLNDVVQTLSELGKSAVPVEEAQRAAYRRERIVRLLGTAITAESQRARGLQARPWLFVAAAAALVLGGAGGWLRLTHTEPVLAQAAPASAGEARVISGAVSVRRNGEAQVLHVGEVFVGGEVVSTAPRSVVEIGIASGRAELEASSELELVRPTASERRLRLGVGSVDVDLPHKLGAGKHLVVETPDAEVVVVGTSFTVDVAREQGTPKTHVRVRRGTVWVTQTGKPRAVLTAGDDWSSVAPVARPAPPEPVTPVAVTGARRTLRNSARTNGARATEGGTLAEENRLFQSGLSARNAGDSAGAAEAFASLLSRYPRSVLREQALAEQFRALARAGRGSAATVAARRYLAGYPSGFARADAELLTSGLPGER